MPELRVYNGWLCVRDVVGAWIKVFQCPRRVVRGLKLLDDIDSGAVELWSEGSNRKEKR